MDASARQGDSGRARRPCCSRWFFIFCSVDRPRLFVFVVCFTVHLFRPLSLCNRLQISLLSCRVRLSEHISQALPFTGEEMTSHHAILRANRRSRCTLPSAVGTTPASESAAAGRAGSALSKSGQPRKNAKVCVTVNVRGPDERIRSSSEKKPRRNDNARPRNGFDK